MLLQLLVVALKIVKKGKIRHLYKWTTKGPSEVLKIMYAKNE